MATHSRSRRWIPPLSGLLAVLSLAPQLRSQSVNSAPAPAGETENTIVLEAFNVTGSNRRRIDQGNTRAVAVPQKISRDAWTPLAWLTGLPQIFNVSIKEAALGARDCSSDNVADKPAPLGSGGKGFDPAVYTQLFAGRTWSIEVTKRF